MAGEAGVSKVCVICKQDCSTKPRTKDAQGRYYCKSCYDAAKSAKRAVPPPVAPPLELSPQDDHPFGMLDKLLEIAPPPQQPHAIGQQLCPSCHAPLNAGTVICVHCGYNVQSGKHVQMQRVTAAESENDKGAILSIIFHPLTVSLAILACMVVFAAISWGDPDAVESYILVDAVFGVTIGITVLVAAFKESIVTGFLTLCVPCYALYYVYGVCENTWIKLLFAVSIITRVLGLGAGMAADAFDQMGGY